MPTFSDKTLFSAFSSRSPATIFSISLVLLLMLGWLDFITGDYSLIVFYLIPVSLTAWFVSRRCGIIICFLTLAVRVLADEAARSPLFHYSKLHYWNVFIEFFFLLIMSLLFSALKKNIDQEKTHAHLDLLTGALNRGSFFKLAEFELNRSRRYKRPFTVAYIDLDNLKSINDRFGHHIGDEVLVSVVRTIKQNIRNYETLSRFGGDEFVILLPEADEEAALSFLTKIHTLLHQAMDNKNWQVGISIVAIIYLSTPPSVDEIIGKADELMLALKRSGKSRLLHSVVK